MNLKKFFVFSVLLHIILFIGVYFIHHDKIKKGKEFITKLVSPEELRKPEIIPTKPKLRLPNPAVARPKPRKLSPPSLPHTVTRHPEPLPKERLVPGEVKEPGKSPPESINQKFGKQEGEETGKAKLSQSKPLEKPGYSETKKLFDTGVINQIAKRGMSEKKTQDKPITFDTSEFRYMGYMNLLRGRLESSGCWIYPPDAAAQGIYGDLRIRFTIKKNGQLGAVELVRTSGYRDLDDAALKALSDCGPYWPLPDEWGKEAYTIEGHFIYTLYGFHIR